MISCRGSEEAEAIAGKAWVEAGKMCLTDEFRLRRTGASSDEIPGLTERYRVMETATMESGRLG